MQIFKLASAIIIASNMAASFSQPCTGTHKALKCSIQTPDIVEFKSSSYSRNILLKAKAPYKYSMVLAPGKDYIIGVCCEIPYKPVKFKLLDQQNDTVIYDNSEDNYTESVGLTVEENPLNLMVEVTVLANDFQGKEVTDLKSCMDLLIMHRKIGKKGFY